MLGGPTLTVPVVTEADYLRDVGALQDELAKARLELTTTVRRLEERDGQAVRWTTSKPTVEGEYWFRKGNIGPYVIRVEVFSGVAGVRDGFGDWFPLTLDLIHGDEKAEWAGPLSPPTS